MTRLPDLVILTEGDWARGLGHLGRCLGYAQQWRRMGRQVLWIVDGDESARRFLEGEIVVWRRWQDDGHIPEVEGAVAIADSYGASPAALQAIAGRAAAAVYLDDLELDDYPPGLVVHSAPGPLERSGPSPGESRFPTRFSRFSSWPAAPICVIWADAFQPRRAASSLTAAFIWSGGRALAENKRSQET